MSFDKPSPPRVVDERLIYDGFIKLTQVTVEAPWAGRLMRFSREVHFHGHGAAILPVDVDRRMALLIRQFRLPAFLDDGDGWLWEVPAGLLEGDAPDACVTREAREETGAEVDALESLGGSLSSPGIMREVIHLYWGRYSGPHSARTGGLDSENEMIEVHELPLSKVGEMADQGEITDSKSAVAIFRLRARHPALFR